MRKALSVLPAVFFRCLLFSQSFPTDTVFTLVEHMPYFAGCEQWEKGTQLKRNCSNQALINFLSQNLDYPEQAKAAGVEGVVYVSFILDEDGQMQDARVLKDIGYGCGEEALKVLKEMPDWEPGEHQSQKVRVRLNLPVQFSLKEKDPDLSEGYTLTWGSLTGKAVSADELSKNLGQRINVRDPYGNDRYVDELAFTFSKNKKLHHGTSRGSLTEDLARVVEKVKKGGVFTITASVQDRGKFIYVTRSFEIN